MTEHLNVDTKTKEPVAVKEDYDDKKAEGFILMNSIPEGIAPLRVKPPFDESTYTVIDSKPKAKPQIGTLPGVRYIVN